MTRVAGRVQEVLEYNTYSKAADVYSLGAILWEILHSKPCYRRTVVGFPVRHPDFPKFAESAPLPYAALTAACLHSNPSVRCGRAVAAPPAWRARGSAELPALTGAGGTAA